MNEAINGNQQESIVELAKVSSNGYVLQRVIVCFFIVLTPFLYASFFYSKFGAKPFVHKYDLSQSAYIIGYIATVLSFLLGFIFAVINLSRKGVVYLSKSTIRLDNKSYSVGKIENIAIDYNPTKYKPRQKRNLFNGGGNNWLKFSYLNKNYKFEFLLKSKEEEDLMHEIVNEWSMINDVQVGVSVENAILSLFDSEANYETINPYRRKD